MVRLERPEGSSPLLAVPYQACAAKLAADGRLGLSVE